MMQAVEIIKALNLGTLDCNQIAPTVPGTETSACVGVWFTNDAIVEKASFESAGVCADL